MTSPPDPPASPDVHPRLGLRSLAVIALIATLLGGVLASQVVLITAGFDQPVSWSAALRSGLLESWLWAAFVPPVFVLTRYCPLYAQRWPWHLAAHLGASLLVATLYSAAHTSLSSYFLADQIRHVRIGRPPRPPQSEPTNPSPSTHETTAPTPPPKFDRPPERRGPPPGAFRAPTFQERFQFYLSTRLSLLLTTYALIVGVWHWLAQQSRLRERERHARTLSRQLAEARLQALRMQLNPHFLFNTLNAIATLIHRDPQAADEMLACLSDFLRLTLSAPNTPESTLQQELDFARRYLDIEKVRFGHRLTVTESIPQDCLTATVPSLLLQPLLENAIRHGIEPSPQPGTVSLQAQLTPQYLLLSITDSGPGLSPQPNPNPAPTPTSSPDRPGIGLANTRARLLELYGNLASLELVSPPHGGLTVHIQIPRKNPSPSPAV